MADAISDGILDDIEVNVTSVSLVSQHPGIEYPGLISTVDQAAIYDTVSVLKNVANKVEGDGQYLGAEELTKNLNVYKETTAIALCLEVKQLSM